MLLIVLADKDYIGAGEHILTPCRGRNKLASQKAANSAHAKLRAPGEQANAGLKTGGILRKPLLLLARRADRQGHPRPSDPPHAARPRRNTGGHGLPRGSSGPTPLHGALPGSCASAT